MAYWSSLPPVIEKFMTSEEMLKFVDGIDAYLGIEGILSACIFNDDKFVFDLVVRTPSLFNSYQMSYESLIDFRNYIYGRVNPPKTAYKNV